MKRTIVITGNAQQFKVYCQLARISHYDPSVLYATRYNLLGIRAEHIEEIVKYGLWWDADVDWDRVALLEDEMRLLNDGF